MKRNVLFAATAVAGVLLLGSCGESQECECIRATAEAMAKSRESGYKDRPKADENESCVEFAKSMKGKSDKEIAEMVEAQKSCDAYADLEKEQKLFQKHLKKQMDEAMQDFE